MRGNLLLDLIDFLLQLSVLPLLLLNLGVKLLDLQLDRVQLDEELRVLLGPLLDVILSTRLILDSVDLERGNRALHVSQLSVELFERLRVLLALAQVLVGGLRHHVVLVELHHARHVGLLVLRLDNLVHVTRELQDRLLLLRRRIFLLAQVQVQLVDLRLLLGQLLPQLVHFLHLLFKNVFEVEQLILKILDSLLLRL